MEASAVSAEARARANELYWGSSRSVNQIAEDLELSKGALYQIIQPLETGLGCPQCGAEAVYPNRTAKERRLVDCPACEWDGSTDEAVAADGAPHPGGSALAARPARRPAPAAPTPPEPAGTRAIVGGALLGAAAGLALVLWARRR